MKYLEEVKNKYFLNYEDNDFEKINELLISGLESVFAHAGKGPVYPITEKANINELINNSKVNENISDPKEIIKEIPKNLEGCQKAGHHSLYRNVLPQPNILGLVTNLIASIYMPNGVTGEDAGNAVNSELLCVGALSELANYDKAKAAGLFTFGGTGTNMYAVKIGLTKANCASGQKGNIVDTVVLGSGAAHYCHEVVTNWLGIGEDNFIKINTNLDQTTKIEELKNKFEEVVKNGKKVACIMLSGGTTSNMGIDDVKEIYDFREYIVKKYKLSYKPHIHFDSVIGWAYLMFRDYDIEKNELDFSQETCKQLQKILKKLVSIHYADSFGVDFHKTGYVNYVSSMFMVKDRQDLDLLKKKKEKTTPLFHDDLAYNPGFYTLETSRSAASMLATWLSFLAIGKNGYRALLGHALEMGNSFRRLFGNEINKGLYIINKDYYGPDIFIGCTFNNIDYDKLINDDEILEKNNKLTGNFAKWLMENKSSGDKGYTISKSSAAIYNKNGKAVVGIRVYPLNPYITEKDIENLVEEILLGKEEYDAIRRG